MINIIANLISVVLFTLWLRLYLRDWRIRIFLVTLFITQWHGPVRFTYYDPTYTDPWLYVFLLAGLIAIQHVKTKPGLLSVLWVGLITFVGVLFREIVMILPVSLAFITNPLSGWSELSLPIDWRQVFALLKKPYYLCLLPLLLGIAGFLIVRNAATQYNDYSFITTAIDWAYNKPILTYFHAYYITFGPLLILLIFSFRRSVRFLWENQFLLVFLVGMMLMGWISGSDTERFLYWAAPVVYLLIGLFLQEDWHLLKSPWLIALLAASTICSQRLFWIVPDYPNNDPTPVPIFSILSSRFQYLDLWSFFAERNVQMISFLEYLLLTAIVLIWLALRQKSIHPQETMQRSRMQARNNRPAWALLRFYNRD